MRAIHPNSFVTVFAKDHRFAVLEIEHAIRPHAPLSKLIESVIVKDIAVLIDLDEGDPLVFGRGLYYRPEMFDIDINRARHKGRFAGDGE